QRRYDLEDLEEWLSWQRPLIEIPDDARAKLTGEPGHGDDPNDPFLYYARKIGFKPPIDVQTAFKEMKYGGEGDTSIHQTQLRTSAALIGRGVEPEKVVGMLMEATLAAAGLHSACWNWRREEKKIRKMVDSAVAKWGKAEQVSPHAAGANVVAIGAANDQQ